MTQELTKELAAVCMMGGVIIWVERERIAPLEAIFGRPRTDWPQFIEIDGEMVNPSRVEGIFTSTRMDEMQRRRNGQWVCKAGKWHDRGEKCDCIAERAREARYRRGAQITAPECSDPDLKSDCSGCTDKRSEGTHQGCTKQHGHVGCRLSFT